MRTLLIALTIAATTLYAADTPTPTPKDTVPAPTPAPTVESLKADLAQRDAVIAKLRADLADAEARRDVGWDLLTACTEQQVIIRKRVPRVPQQ